MIYLDTSVLLAQLFSEDRHPDDPFWNQTLVSSRLLEYEIWTRIHGRRLTGSHGEAARSLIGRIAFLELAPPVLARALEPFPAPVRTLDALHLASVLFLRAREKSIRLASYDERQIAAARRLRIRVTRP